VGGAARATGLFPPPPPHAAGTTNSAPIASTRRARRVTGPKVWIAAHYGQWPKISAVTLPRMPAHASESAAVARGANPFADTEDQAALRQLARDVAERSLAPMARQGDETEEFPQASWDAMRQAELFGITIGEQWGGAGMGDVEAAIVLEELARADVSSAILAQLIFNGPPRAIEHLGSDALRDRWL